MTSTTSTITPSTYSELKELISNSPKLIVMCSAPWCGPCKAIKPKYNQLAEENSDITFVYLDAEAFSDPEKEYLQYVKAYPTFFSYHNGLLHNTFIGAKMDSLKSTVSSLNEK